jgi:hypothetical protein
MRGPPVCLRNLTAEEASAVESLARSRTAAARRVERARIIWRASQGETPPSKTDAADAEAICEAVTRPTMHFVPIKTAEQQAVLMLHRSRDLAGPATHHAGERFARTHGRAGHHRPAGDQPCGEPCNRDPGRG